MVSKTSREPRYRTSEFCHHTASLTSNLAILHTEHLILHRHLKKGPTDTLLDAIKVYRDALVKTPKKGWRMLMEADRFTGRDFLLQ